MPELTTQYAPTSDLLGFRAPSGDTYGVGLIGPIVFKPRLEGCIHRGAQGFRVLGVRERCGAERMEWTHAHGSAERRCVESGCGRFPDATWERCAEHQAAQESGDS